ncbi:MAG: protein translocase subunit SecF [Acidobacteria bacterium]|nr:protein translocase subunit SecF [Acidobacteriota bacterium]
MARFTDFGNDLYTGKRSIDFVGKRRIWFGIAILLVIAALAVPLIRGGGNFGDGFKFGIEFRGGSQFQISGATSLNTQIGDKAVHSVVPNAVVAITTVGKDGVQVQTNQLTNDQTIKVSTALASTYGVKDSNVTSTFIGATWGGDITKQAVIGLLVFLALAALFMAIYFRTWKMSVAAIMSLAHDLIITAGVYALTGFEVTPATVIGFLTILGYSLYDTVVVFDKIRENTAELGDDSSRTFGEAVNLAVNQTLVRSINTGVVAALPVAAILFIGSFILGANTLRDISLALLVGTLIGTYSTPFVASPLYASFRQREDAIRKRDKRVLAQRSKSAAVTA